MNARFRNAELACDSQELPALLSKSADSSDSLGVHRDSLHGTPSLTGSIAHVVCISPEEQVLRVYAGRSIARMANKKTIWYLPHKFLIRDSVRSAMAKIAIAVYQTSLPQPASIFRNLNFPKQPFFSRRQVERADSSQAKIMSIAKPVGIENIRASGSSAGFHGVNGKSGLRHCQEHSFARQKQND